jgi:hypothetical protein
MVQTDLSQLSAESKEWRHILNNYRQEIQEYKDLLPGMCGKPLSKEQLVQVEQYHNQFHIQLINIHDVKRAIKNHEQKTLADENHISNDVYAEHERLLHEFLTLENSLQELRRKFNHFVDDISCLQ